MGIDPLLPLAYQTKKKKNFFDKCKSDTEAAVANKMALTRFKDEILYKVIDSVCESINYSYQATFQIIQNYWTFLALP